MVILGRDLKYKARVQILDRLSARARTKETPKLTEGQSIQYLLVCNVEICRMNDGNVTLRRSK